MTADRPIPAVSVRCAGDAALAAEFPGGLDEATNARASEAADVLRVRWGAILRDVVVGFRSVTAYYDPRVVDAAWLEGELCLAAEQAVGDARLGRTFTVPVCYDSAFAPDLPDIAAFAGCTVDEVIARHTARRYRVYMIGFVPGFAYMAAVDPHIAAPRRGEPRASVPAGAVAIAGAQTGIYPSETPGGWNIVGRTPLRPWDDAREEPSLFRPGDLVEFVRVGAGALDGAA